MLFGGVDFIDPLDTDGYVSLGRPRMVSATAADIAATLPNGGDLGDLNVSLLNPDVDGAVVVTIFINGTETTVTCTVSIGADTCADTTNTATIAGGDTVAVRIENSDGVIVTDFNWTASLAAAP